MSADISQTVQIGVGIAGVILLAAYVVLTYGLLRSSERQAEHLSRTLDLTRQDLAFRTRPWLGIEDIDPMEGQESSSIWIVKTRNYGLGVATRASLSFVLQTRRRSEGWVRQWAGTTPEIEVFPGQTQRLAVQLEDKVLRDMDSEDVELDWELTLSYRWEADGQDSMHQIRRWIREDRCWAAGG